MTLANQQRVAAAELSLAVYYWENYIFPPIGALWKVDAEIDVGGESPVTDLQFEFRITEELISGASSRVEYAKTTFPVRWEEDVGKTQVRIHPKKQIETNDDALVALSDYAVELTAAFYRETHSVWISFYLDRYWRPSSHRISLASSTEDNATASGLPWIISATVSVPL